MHAHVSLLHMLVFHLTMPSHLIISGFTIGRHTLAKIVPVSTWLVLVVEKPILMDVFFITELVKRKFHFSSNDQVVSILDTHLSERLGLTSHWFLTLDIDIHLLFLDQLSELQVFDHCKNALVQHLKTLVGTNFNLKRLVQLVVQLRSFDADFQSHRPGLFLSVVSSQI